MSMAECYLIAKIFHEANFSNITFNRDFMNVTDRQALSGTAKNDEDNRELIFSYFLKTKEIWLFATLAPGYYREETGHITKTSSSEALIFKVSLFDNGSVEMLRDFLLQFLKTEFNVFTNGDIGLNRLLLVDPSILPE